jgi:DNA-binding SARP family transcriptional activator/tetratricopeptide (TPR) repeat protein
MDFGLLGSLRVVVDGRPATSDQPMPNRLLAILICRAGTSVSVDRLIEQLWEGAPPVSARKTVQLYVHRLRKMLGDPGRIRHGAGGYTLVIHPGERDLDQVEELVRAARATTDQRTRAALLADALALWRGEPMAEFTDLPEVRALADRLADYRATVLEMRFDADLELGRHADLVGELTAAVTDQPLRERFAAQLMLALYRCGRQAEALAVYRRARDRLVEELGVEPGAELHDRHLAILRADPALDPPARWTTVPAAQLPPRPRPFTGRAAELDLLDGLLAGGGSPATVVISAISGTAGVGKTALAVHWAHRMRDRFPDGQLYVNLRGFAVQEPVTAAEALTTLLSALGVPPDRLPTAVAEASGLYRSILAERRVLVLLDNASGAEQVRPLLPGTPASLAVITSRNRLSGLIAIDGAHRLLLDPMPVADACDLLRAILGESRPTDPPEALAVLADICDHLPLALRIAAANLVDEPDRPIGDYLDELRTSRLDVLAVHDDDQAAVGAAFALSYRHLEPSAQRMFRLLGLVADLEVQPSAAAALAGADEAEAVRLLDVLADAHLLQPLPNERWTFHDLIRRYAEERADSDEPGGAGAAALDRLYHWYLVRICSSDRLLMPARPPLLYVDGPQAFDTALEALAWLDLEQQNIGALVRHAAAAGRQVDAFRIPYLMRGYYQNRNWASAVEIQRLSVAAAVALGDADLEDRARSLLAAALTRARDHEAAIVEQQRALALARQAGDRQRVALALNNIGWMFNESGSPERALTAYQDALALFDTETKEDRPYVSTALQNAGDVLSLLGQHADAVDHHRRALAIARADGDSSQESDSLTSLGEAHARAGDHRQAIVEYRAALTVLAENGNRFVEALTRGVLADSLRALGETDAAAGELAAAAELHRTLGDVPGAIGTLIDLAGLHLAEGDHLAARKAVDEAAALHAGSPDPREAHRLAEIAASLEASPR